MDDVSPFRGGPDQTPRSSGFSTIIQCGKGKEKRKIVKSYLTFVNDASFFGLRIGILSSFAVVQYSQNLARHYHENHPTENKFNPWVDKACLLCYCEDAFKGDTIDYRRTCK